MVSACASVTLALDVRRKSRYTIDMLKALYIASEFF